MRTMRSISWWMWNHNAIHCGNRLAICNSCWKTIANYTSNKMCKCIVLLRNASLHIHSNNRLIHVHDVELSSYLFQSSWNRMDIPLWIDNRSPLHLFFPRVTHWIGTSSHSLVIESNSSRRDEDRFHSHVVHVLREHEQSLLIQWNHRTYISCF